jgi:hypothetical protein
MALLVSMSFKKGVDDFLTSFAKTAHLKMSTDPQYLPFKSYYDDINVKNEAFTLSIADALLGGKNQTRNKNSARAALVKVLVATGHQLEDNANDMEQFVTDAGFELRNTGRKNRKTKMAPVTELATPDLKAENLDTPGYARLTWQLVPNALLYAIRHKLLTETDWQNGNYDHKGEFVFTNLQSKQVYEFEVTALGPDNVKSNPAQAIPVYVS